MNDTSELEKLTIANNSRSSGFLSMNDDPYNNFILKPESQITEDVDYKILNEECFSYLFGIYGGTDIRRWSIAVPAIQDGDEQSES